MLPEHAIEFCIDLLPGTAPIAKRSYRMAPIEHEEVKKTIDELLAKGYICRSFSPWAFPLLLVDKNVCGLSGAEYSNHQEQASTTPY